MTWLVVGLGNPGFGYSKTRHNVGFMTADVVAGRLGVRWKRTRGISAETAVSPGAPLGLAGQIVVVKPLTFMNNSGDAVAPLARYYRTDPAQIIVVHDEIDLDFGVLRVKLGGGDNGHNGLKSVRARLGTGEFYRVRIGVSRPPGSRDPMDWVLGAFPATQKEDLKINIAEAADAVESLMRVGLSETQNRFNR